MENDIFKDLLPDDAFDSIRSGLYNPYQVIKELQEQVTKLNKEFEIASSLLRKARKHVSNSKDKYHVINLKDESEKVAYLIQDFVNEFRETYEQTLALYTAEKLAGNLDYYFSSGSLSYGVPVGGNIFINGNVVSSTSNGTTITTHNNALNAGAGSISSQLSQSTVSAMASQIVKELSKKATFGSITKNTRKVKLRGVI